MKIKVTINEQTSHEQHVPNQMVAQFPSKTGIVPYYETSLAINDNPYKDSLVNVDKVFREVLRVL